MERDDKGLLRQYIDQNSQAAFAQLTERYLRLVYGTCLRELNDPVLAEDATQVVFLILARKAAGLRSQDALAGWLFTTSRLTARQLQKQERLRRDREQHAFQHETMAKDENPARSQMADRLNEALARLGPKDRAVILLRFFEGLSLKEVGDALGISENTARMRVVRSVDKLRRQVTRDGMAASTVAFTALLSAESARALPATSAAGVTQGVFDAIASAGSPPSLSAHLLQQATEGVLRQLFINKLRTAATIAGIGIVGFSSGIYAFTSHAVRDKVPHKADKAGLKADKAGLKQSRPGLSALAAAPVLTAVQAKAAIQQVCSRMDAAVSRKDAVTTMAFFAPEFQMATPRGGQANRARLATGFRLSFEQPEPIHERTVVQQAMVKGDRVMVIVSQSLDRGSPASGRSQILRLTWRSVGQRWLMTRMDALTYVKVQIFSPAMKTSPP